MLAGFYLDAYLAFQTVATTERSLVSGGMLLIIEVLSQSLIQACRTCDEYVRGCSAVGAAVVFSLMCGTTGWPYMTVSEICLLRMAKKNHGIGAKRNHGIGLVNALSPGAYLLASEVSHPHLWILQNEYSYSYMPPNKYAENSRRRPPIHLLAPLKSSRELELWLVALPTCHVMAVAHHSAAIHGTEIMQAQFAGPRHGVSTVR
jgi:hypothetical protein